jgi:hypothetical protein
MARARALPSITFLRPGGGTGGGFRAPALYLVVTRHIASKIGDLRPVFIKPLCRLEKTCGNRHDPKQKNDR